MQVLERQASDLEQNKTLIDVAQDQRKDIAWRMEEKPCDRKHMERSSDHACGAAGNSEAKTGDATGSVRSARTALIHLCQRSSGRWVLLITKKLRSDKCIT